MQTPFKRMPWYDIKQSYDSASVMLELWGMQSTPLLSFLRVLHSHNHIHIHAETKSTAMTSKHASLEKYTSHTLFEMVAKGLCVKGELETEQTATYWPQVPLSLAELLSRSAGLLNRGSCRPIDLCWVLVLSTASYLQLNDSKLTELPVAPGYVIV